MVDDNWIEVDEFCDRQSQVGSPRMGKLHSRTSTLERENDGLQDENESVIT